MLVSCFGLAPHLGCTPPSAQSRIGSGPHLTLYRISGTKIKYHVFSSTIFGTQSFYSLQFYSLPLTTNWLIIITIGAIKANS